MTRACAGTGLVTTAPAPTRAKGRHAAADTVALAPMVAPSPMTVGTGVQWPGGFAATHDW